LRDVKNESEGTPQDQRNKNKKSGKAAIFTENRKSKFQINSAGGFDPFEIGSNYAFNSIGDQSE
jgi:hypothetical protein